MATQVIRFLKKLWKRLFHRDKIETMEYIPATKENIDKLKEDLPPPVNYLDDLDPEVLLWDIRENIRHSVRVICDRKGLSVEQKNTLCATIQGESNFKLDAKNENKRNGKVLSTDWGICQWNDYYHGKEISPEEAVNNPEKAVRLMCAYWKRGQRNLWIAYRNKSYLRYL